MDFRSATLDTLQIPRLIVASRDVQAEHSLPPPKPRSPPTSFLLTPMPQLEFRYYSRRGWSLNPVKHGM